MPGAPGGGRGLSRALAHPRPTVVTLLSCCVTSSAVLPRARQTLCWDRLAGQQ